MFSVIASNLEENIDINLPIDPGSGKMYRETLNESTKWKDLDLQAFFKLYGMDQELSTEDQANVVNYIKTQNKAILKECLKILVLQYNLLNETKAKTNDQLVRIITDVMDKDISFYSYDDQQEHYYIPKNFTHDFLKELPPKIKTAIYTKITNRFEIRDMNQISLDNQ
jgi:hypothetical protein